MNKLTGEKKLSKRTVLYIVNAVAFVIVATLAILDCISLAGLSEYFEPEFATAYATTYVVDIITQYFVIQCVFTALSLIIYYLSIISDSYSTKKSAKDSRPTDKIAAEQRKDLK